MKLQKILTDNPLFRIFTVISWGCAATGWLARALNAHPDVFCVHEANHKWARNGGVPLLDGLPYLNIVALMGGLYAAAGDVHGVGREHVPALKRILGDHFGCAVVVREPLARLRSQIALFEQNHYKGWGDLSYVNALAEAAGLNPDGLTPKQRHLIHGVDLLNAITAERDLGPVYRCEDLTSDPVSLCNLLSDLTGRSLSPSRAWADAAIGSGAKNTHVGTAAAQPFDDWLRGVIRACVTPQAWESYAELGYKRPEI